MPAGFKPLLVIGAIVVAMVGFAAFRNARDVREADDHHDGVAWRASLAAAKTESAKSNKPVLIYFTAPWCGPCQRMKAETWPDAGVHAALEDFVPVRVDVDGRSDVAQEFGVTEIPQMRVLMPDGKPGEGVVGPMTPEQLIRWLHAARKA